LALDPADRFRDVEALLDALAIARDEGRDRHYRTHAALSMFLTLFHFFSICAVTAILLAIVPEDDRSGGELAGCCCLYVLVAWLPGAFLAPLNTYAFATRRRWARYTGLIYALLVAPSVFGTAYSIYAFFTLLGPRERHR
jgi:hypothetical protein